MSIHENDCVNKLAGQEALFIKKKQFNIGIADYSLNKCHYV